MFLTLGACLALATFLAAILLGSAAAAAIWRLASRRTDLLPARSEAAGLLLLRLLPSVTAGVLVLGVFAPAFYRLEPRGTGETAGPWLVALASVAALLILNAARRLGRAWLTTRSLVRRWLATSTPVTLHGAPMPVHAIPSQFPVVSVVGVTRPRLFVSDRVLRECTPEELAAVVRHECAHVAAADNLKRALLPLCPDLLALMPFGRAIEQQWHEASEDAADDDTKRMGSASAVALANALVRVARMGASMRAPALPTASLYNGDPVERRVRRLLGDAAAQDERGTRLDRAARRPAWIFAVRAAALVPIVLAVVVILHPAALRGVYEVIEAVVETLS
jgi:Zn-dependent protease with chaperone function